MTRHDFEFSAPSTADPFFRVGQAQPTWVTGCSFEQWRVNSRKGFLNLHNQKFGFSCRVFVRRYHLIVSPPACSRIHLSPSKNRSFYSAPINKRVAITAAQPSLRSRARNGERSWWSFQSSRETARQIARWASASEHAAVVSPVDFCGQRFHTDRLSVRSLGQSWTNVEFDRKNWWRSITGQRILAGLVG